MAVISGFLPDTPGLPLSLRGAMSCVDQRKETASSVGFGSHSEDEAGVPPVTLCPSLSHLCFCPLCLKDEGEKKSGLASNIAGGPWPEAPRSSL